MRGAAEQAVHIEKATVEGLKKNAQLVSKDCTEKLLKSKRERQAAEDRETSSMRDAAARKKAAAAQIAELQGLLRLASGADRRGPCRHSARPFAHIHRDWQRGPRLARGGNVNSTGNDSSRQQDYGVNRLDP